MSSIDAGNVDKSLEIIHPDNLPEASCDDVAKGLTALVSKSAEENEVDHHLHAPLRSIHKLPWVASLIPGIEKLAAEHHIGNFVVVRGSQDPFFESMPLYARIGMHLLFYGREQIKALGSRTVEDHLREQSIKQGRIYNSPESVHSIPSFVKTYHIQMEELLEPDLTKYKSFNEFFYRKLRPDARPVQNKDNNLGICSAADSRLIVYPTVDLAKQFWVKGKQFDIPNLLNIKPDSPEAIEFVKSSIAIFRLAPADYHRFHSPIDCIVEGIKNVPGQYYTVNPQAVNESNFDVLTANTRSILHLKHIATGRPVAFVAIGAMLVGSITWTGGKEKGDTIKRGDELGYFAYGGSTIVVVFANGIVEFDEDLVRNSQKPMETLVKVGYSIGETRALK